VLVFSGFVNTKMKKCGINYRSNTLSRVKALKPDDPGTGQDPFNLPEFKKGESGSRQGEKVTQAG